MSLFPQLFPRVPCHNWETSSTLSDLNSHHLPLVMHIKVSLLLVFFKEPPLGHGHFSLVHMFSCFFGYFSPSYIHSSAWLGFSVDLEQLIALSIGTYDHKSPSTHLFGCQVFACCSFIF